MPRATVLAAIILVCGFALAQSDQLQLQPVQVEEVLALPAQDWVTTVTAPEGEGVVVLGLDARLHVPGSKGGGCNWVLRLWVNDRVVRDSQARPRLLNKPASFDFSGGQYHFTWYNRDHDAWMVMFADSYDFNTAGTGQDSRYLLDLSSFVRPGQTFQLRVAYAQPNLPAALKQQAPLAVRNVGVGLLAPETVAAMRDAAIADVKNRRIIQIQSAPDSDEQPGEPPYEIAWAKRPEKPTPQVTFEHLDGWTAEARGDAEVTLAASRAQRIWRDQTLRVRFGQGRGTSVVITPPEPIQVPADTNAVNFWLHSNHGHSATGAPVQVTVAVTDKNGNSTELDCGSLRGDYWELRQGLIEEQLRSDLEPPLSFHSITLSCSRVDKPITMYLESLAFHKRERKPYAALGRLTDPPFPTSEDNMLPPPPAGCEVSVQRLDDGSGVRFVSRTGSSNVTYIVRPVEGGFGGITARLNDGAEFQPMADAAIELITPKGPVSAKHAQLTCEGWELEGTGMTQRWRIEAGESTVRYTVSHELRGRALMVEVDCPGGVATALDLGKVRGPGDLRGIEIPYLMFRSAPGPCVAMGAGAFTSVLPDWYHSASSRLDSTGARTEPDDDGLRIAGHTRYMKLTDGTLNDLHERILVTVSDDIHDVLPSIATPRSPKLEELAPDMYVMSSVFTPGYYQTLKRYGLDHIISVTFAQIWWQRVGEGFAMRWRPRPDLSIDQVARYREQIKSLGYKWGMIVNYDCYLPINEFWDEGKVCLNSDGSLADGWFGHYWTKNNAMAGIAREVGRRIREHYPTDCVYLDVHTNIGPDAQDFEAGVEGAGTARATVLGNAECIREVHVQQGSLCSEGICRWMYAGLADMDYAQWAGVTKPDVKPLLPDFDLLRIHPKQIGTAMGYLPTCFFGTEALAEFNKDPGKGTDHQPFYHWLAATIAHGHSAMIGYGYFPSLARTIHYYSLLSGPQREYLPDTVAGIQWYSEAASSYVSTSEALRSGVRDQGRLRVTYSRGLTVYVNYNREQPWKLSVGGREHVLPPFGWVMHKPGEILAYSALVDGRRVDYVDCPEYTYLNSGVGPVTEGPVTVDGAVLIRKGRPLRVIPCGDLGSWRALKSEEYPIFNDQVLAGPPVDRGVKQLRLNLPGLLNRTEGITLRTRDEEGDQTPGIALHEADVELTPSADVTEWLIE
ncbi:MAG: hypothetical protein HPY44_09490 [Armatimonadetes bacterium]|nr:hypothetical protein [Armatimonadota bacterium]